MTDEEFSFIGISFPFLLLYAFIFLFFQIITLNLNNILVYIFSFTLKCVTHYVKQENKSLHLSPSLNITATQ